MEDNFYDEPMDMPTPCEHCNTIFDLNDGYGSEKWHPNITICTNCHDEEEKEIEEDDYYQSLNEELCNALYGIEEKKGAWERLDKDNQALIIQLVSHCFFDDKELSHVRQWFNTTIDQNQDKDIEKTEWELALKIHTKLNIRPENRIVKNCG